MSNIIFFDCFSGISGDMALGALLDAGLELGALRAELDKLGVAGWTIAAQRGQRSFLAGTQALVHAPEQPVHRHLGDVVAIINASTLAPTVKQQSIRVFTLLAEAEGRVHGVAAEAVHFHEVGALDAIVDIVGVVAGLALLGIEAVYASPLPLGRGWTRAAHGQLPLPAPAVLELLSMVGAPTVPDETPAELVTPTGAALLAGLATFSRPAFAVERIGYGLGMRQLERPNALRVWVGTAASTAPAELHPVLLETNLDDQPGEQIAYAMEQLLALGALDVWLAPIQMKKGRPAVLLAVLVPPALEAAAVALVLRETTTLGVRRRIVERYVAERSMTTVETVLGAVRVKQKHWQGITLGSAPEYEDCARLAREHGIALQQVYQLVQRSMAAGEHVAGRDEPPQPSLA